MPKINTSVITDKSITKEKLNDELQGKINNIGNLPSLYTNAKDTLVNSINELYNNTVNGKNLLADAIRQKGIDVGDDTPSYQQLYDWILSINYIAPDLGIVKTINTLDDWTEHASNPTKPDDTIGTIDIYMDSILSARLNITQWNKQYDYDWYLVSVQFFNNKIKRITIDGIVPGYYDSEDLSQIKKENFTKIIVTNKTDDYYQIKYFKNSDLMHISVPIENNYGANIYANEIIKKYRELGRKVMRGFTINID